MNCDEMREYLLEASIEEVQDATDGNALAESAHLKACEQCATLAGLLMSRTAMLETEYRMMASHVPGAAAADVAIHVNAVTPRAPGTEPTSLPVASSRPGILHARRVGPRRIRYELPATVLALCIAAALLLLLRPSNEPAADPDVVSTVPATVAVEVGENQNAIIFETRNPKITVVWLYSSGN